MHNEAKILSSAEMPVAQMRSFRSSIVKTSIIKYFSGCES